MPETRTSASQNKQEAETSRTCRTCGLETEPRLKHHSPASWLSWLPEPGMLSGSVFAAFVSLSVIVFRGRIFPLGGLVPAFTTTYLPNQHTEAGSGTTECRRVCVWVLLCVCVCSCTFDSVKNGQRFRPSKWGHFCEVSSFWPFLHAPLRLKKCLSPF